MLAWVVIFRRHVRHSTFFVSVASKELSQSVSLLFAPLTGRLISVGEGPVRLWKFSVALIADHYTQVLSFHILAHSFALAKISTLLFSSASALFAENHPGWGYPSTRFPYLVTSFLHSSSPEA
jgi:hypothetical protein